VGARSLLPAHPYAHYQELRRREQETTRERERQHAQEEAKRRERAEEKAKRRELEMMRELEALRERERQRAEDDATRREEEDRRRGIWSCLPCLIPCFARRKDAFDVEKSAHSNPAHHQHKTGSQARGNPNHIYLFGDCDSDAHLQRGWGDGVSGGKTITIQSSMAYPDDEGEDSDGAHLPGARCEMRDVKANE
jgi:flagellar biosynthesis GTPase FlhF